MDFSEREKAFRERYRDVCIVIHTYYPGTVYGIHPGVVQAYMELLRNTTGLAVKVDEYEGRFDSRQWITLWYTARAFWPEDMPEGTFRRRLRATLQAVHTNVVTGNAHSIMPLFSHMNAFLDPFGGRRCLLSSLLHVREEYRSQDAWLQRRVADGLKELRTMTTNVDEFWEREDREFDDESTAAERMRHGRILGSGHLCVPGAGRSEPVAEREPARDGPECASAASAALPAETTT